MERRLAAILAADVVGYSRLMEQDEAGTLVALKSHRAGLIEPKIAEHVGRIVKLMGDGILVEFPSAVEAVQCAVEIQQSMAALNANKPAHRRIEFRIGINIGDVMVEGDDIYGDGVNVATRIEALAEPGGIWIAAMAHQAICDKLDLLFEDMGEQRVKNIERPIRTYRVRLSEETALLGEATRSTLELPNKPSIAVLPFDNLSGDPGQDYFADGMVEEITAALSRVRSFFVIARNSSFTYRGRAVDMKQVSRELGVRYVIEGSVRKSGKRVRIMAQLIDAVHGVHLWADRYDGVLEDVFDLQDNVTQSIVGAIEPQLRIAEIARSRRKPPENLDAYDCFLRALPHVHAMTVQGNQEAIRLLREAIRIDPDYASALALLAWCFTLRVAQGWVVSKEQEAKEGLKSAQIAIHVAEDDPEPLWLAGYSYAYFGGDFEGGLGFIERALELDPNAAQAWVFSGWINMYIGRADKSVEHFRRAMRLSPLDPTAYRTHAGLAFAYLFLRQFDDAIAWATQALLENERFTVTHRVLAPSLALAGRSSEAQRVVKALQELVPGLTVGRFMNETRFRFPAYLDLLIDGMRKAGLPD